MEEPEGGPGIGPVAVTVLAIVLLLALLLLYRHLTS